MDEEPVMSDLSDLKTRVETTAERLAAAQQNRRRQNSSLLEILGRLEHKFAAQEEELAFYRERVGPLELANTQLAALMQRLLDMVDAGLDSTDDPHDPVREAMAMAVTMLERDMILAAPAAGELPAGLYEDVDAAALAAEDAAEAVFEDADPDDIAAEAAAEAEAAADEFPELVRAAIAAASEPDSVEILAATLGAEVADSDPHQPTAADIRALLERVEAAAARMTSNEESTPADPPTARDPAPHIAGAAA
jgi:hypothetical protein